MRSLSIKDFPIGESSKITREELVSMYGMSDRAIRSEIKRLRDEGYPIMSSTARGKSGYWLPKTYDELESWISMVDSYIYSMMKTLKPVRRMLKDRDQKFINYDVYSAI